MEQCADCGQKFPEDELEWNEFAGADLCDECYANAEAEAEEAEDE